MSDWYVENIARCEQERDKCPAEADKRLWGDAIEVYRHLQSCKLRHGKQGDPLQPKCEEKFE